MNKLRTLFILLACLSIITANTQDDSNEIKDAIEQARGVKATFLETDPGLEKFFDECHAYVIFPSVGKGWSNNALDDDRTSGASLKSKL